jgi:asparagine synthase (glutamine-hydrolysing)
VAVEVTDEQLASAKFRFHQTPTSKEEYYYRSIFHEHFQVTPQPYVCPQEASVACSTKSHGVG